MKIYRNDHVIVSNAIHYTGTSNSFNCLRADLGASAYTDVDHNLCHYPNAPGAEWSDTYGDLAAWQGATGFGGASAAFDPGFFNPSAGSLWATDENAAMVDAGHATLSSPTEIHGVSRDAQPDIGAYEWSVQALFADGFETGDTTAWSAALP